MADRHPFPFLMASLIEIVARTLVALALTVAFIHSARADTPTPSGAASGILGYISTGAGKCGEAPQYFTGMGELGAKFKLLEDYEGSLSTTAKGVGNLLLNPARALGGALAVASLFWGMILALGASKGTPTTVVIDVVLPASVVALLLGAYPQVVDGLGSTARTISDVLPSPWVAMVDFFAAMINTLFGGLTSLIKNFACTKILDAGFLGVLLGTVVALVLLVVAMYMMVRAMVDIVAVIFLGPFLAAVGAAVAPIFIAFGASAWTRPWITAWIGFVVQALLLNVFAALVLKLMSAPFEGMNAAMSFTNNSAADGLTVALDALVILGMSLIASRVFGQIPQIVSTLFPGNLGVVTGDGRKSTVKAAGEAGGILKDVAMKIPGVKTAATGATVLTNKLLGRSRGGSGSGGSSSTGGKRTARPFKTVNSTSGQRAANRMAARRGKSTL
ncbi:type IV secretion system protein [Cupriavidus basilensis]